MHETRGLVALCLAACCGVLWGSAAAAGGNRDSDIEKNIVSEFKTGVETAPDGVVPPAPAAEQQNEAALRAELADARSEIARLQGIVKRILEANRREKADMHYNIGCVFRSGGQYLKAEQEFLKALVIAPDDADVHYNLGILYEENLKNPAKARKHYERYVELAPSEKDAARVSEWLTGLGM